MFKNMNKFSEQCTESANCLKKHMAEDLIQIQIIKLIKKIKICENNYINSQNQKIKVY